MLGRCVREYRLQHGISLEDLSGRCGLPAVDLERIELGATPPPIDSALLLCLLDGLKLRKASEFAEFTRLNRAARFHCYGLGLAKTGTLSLCGIFQGYWTDHEFNQWDTLQMVNRFEEGEVLDKEYLQFVHQRRGRSGFLEMDSAHFNRHYVHILAQAYPDAKFICLIRDCYSWLNSAINYFTLPEREALNSSFRRNGLPFDLPRGDLQAKQRLIDEFPRHLAGTATFWADQNRLMLDRIRALPKERCLIIKTHELSSRLEELADLVGVPVETLNAERSHLNHSQYHVNILSRLDPDTAQATFTRCCGDLMEEFFPGYSLAGYLERLES